MTHDNRGMENSPLNDDIQLPGILVRPAGQMRSLPLKYRWEFTRRHPYYLWVWEKAHRDNSNKDELAANVQMIHQVFLGAIGVSRPLVPPDTSFDSLMAQIDGPLPAWLFGSVQPLSMRGLTGLLLAHLSTESRRRLAELFRNSVENDEDGEDNLIPALLQLQSLDCDELDTYADQPIVAVSPVQTANTLTADLRIFLDDWRDRFGLSEQRIRIDKFDQYLAVWDARERWTGSDYELGDDRSLFDVALHLHMSPSTARNQYRAAFELITGHSYSAATWIRIFGQRKYPIDLMSDINGAVMRRRLKPRGSRPPVPESVLNPNANQSSFHGQSPSAVSHDIALWEMIEDVRTLSGAGRTDTEIAEHLEISSDAVALLRQRIETE